MFHYAMNNTYINSTGDIFMDAMDRKVDILDEVQNTLRNASRQLVTRMAKSMSMALNKSMSSYVDEVLAYRKMNFIDMISVKHQTMSYEEMMIGFKEELDARIEAQIETLSFPEWLVFQFRDANLYFEKGKDAVVSSIKEDILSEFGRLLDEHFLTKRMQGFLERYPWLIK